MKERAKNSPGLAAEIEASLLQLRAQGEVEISEDSSPLPEFAAFQFQVREEPRGAFVHLWNEERNLVRRVLAVQENSASCLALDVSRFGRNKPGRLEFVLRDAARAPQRLSREKFRARLERLWDSQFPDEELISLTTAPDLEHSFSGSYVRGVARSGSSEWALLAASPAENAGTLDAMLTFGLLWLD
ncbi:MAG TPA: hypothetical protein VNL38_03045, partial [Candidatus Nitrosotenuis sp.]|nr:hypothetical protein [Candidatus Nitrosotenuis sp.]